MPTHRVSDLMTRNPMCCTPQDPVTEAARLMGECDCGAIPVVENLQDYHLIGMITDRDIAIRIVAAGLDPSTALVQQGMTGEVITVQADDSLDKCVRLMCENQIRRIPVVGEDGEIIGIVAQADLARASTDEPELEEELADMVEEVSAPSGI